MNERRECRNFINSLAYGVSPKEICKLRTWYCIEWYTKKAIKYKCVFICLSIINIAIPQISAIIVLKGQCALASAVLSSIVSFSTALLALLNVKERWTAYRSAAEVIKREYTLYCIQAPPYQGAEAHVSYLKILEQGMAEEHRHWIGTQKSSLAEGQQGLNSG